MAPKYRKAWMKIALAFFVHLSTITADFTTECQRPCDCKWQSGNKAAICSNSSLKAIPVNLSNDIQILDLSNNNLGQLHHEAFKRVGLSNLKKLFLKESNVETVHKTAFVTLAIMIELDLSRNRIRYLHPDTFKGTEKLRLINLSNNFIDKLEDGLFRNLKFLQKVELSNNRIVKVATKSFVNLPQLKILRFDGNNLSYVKPDTFMALHNLSGLDLHNNPWRCDCNLQIFRDWVISHNLYTPPTACAEPAATRDKLWNELDSTNFACRPTILEPLPDATVRSHEENVTIVCRVVGNPTPDVSWRFNGKTIEPRTFGEIRYVVSENTMDLIRWVNLTIVQARFSDRGNYTCVAENPGGRDEKTLVLILSKYGTTIIAGMDADTFAIVVGCLTALVIIFGAILSFCCMSSQNNETKRLIKTDTRSSNGDVLTEGPAAEGDKGIKMEVNPVTKPPRKYEEPPSITSEATEMSELNKTLLDNDSILASNEDTNRYQDMELPKLSQETLLMSRFSRDNQTDPPDLLSFPPKGKQMSPSIDIKWNGADGRSDSPIKSPAGYGVAAVNQSLYSRFQTPTTSQGSVANQHTKGGYVTLPRKPKMNWPEAGLSPQVLSTLNGVIPYYDNFNMKLFHNGLNYYSLNKSEVDLGINKSGYLDQEELEPAPSPAPGTPHATIPRNSLSSPNIHNQLLALQAMSLNARLKASEKPLTVSLAEHESLLKNKDRFNYSVNVVSGTLGRTRNAPKPPPKPRKRSDNMKEPFLLNGVDSATQV